MRKIDHVMMPVTIEVAMELFSISIHTCVQTMFEVWSIENSQEYVYVFRMTLLLCGMCEGRKARNR